MFAGFVTTGFGVSVLVATCGVEFGVLDATGVGVGTEFTPAFEGLFMKNQAAPAPTAPIISNKARIPTIRPVFDLLAELAEFGCAEPLADAT